jgi:hypothetical protein
MWNSPIEFFNSSYMEILFSVILNSGKLDWSTKSLWLNNISWGFCLVLIVVAFPIWQMLFINSLYKKTEEERDELVDKYGNAFEVI